MGTTVAPQPNGQPPAPPSLVTIAKRHIKRGIPIFPLAAKSKEPPKDYKWRDMPPLTTDAELTHWFGDGTRNIAARLGPTADGRVLVDIDIDDPAFVSLAAAFLPPTNAIFGRTSSRYSHRLYWTDRSVFAQYDDPEPSGKKKRLIELRGNEKHYSMLPGSVHPEGERVGWECTENPGGIAKADAAALELGVARMAAGMLFARRWEDSARHNIALALAGTLLNAGWTEEETKDFIRAIATAAKDEKQITTHLAGVDSTAKKIADGEPINGYAALAEQIGAKSARAVAEWLGIDWHRLRTMKEYVVQNGCLCEVRWQRERREVVPLANFVATITEEVTRDNGSDDSPTVFTIAGTLADGTILPTIHVPAPKFGRMEWVLEQWGARARITAGVGTRDKLRDAIQALSPDFERQHEYGHTGWRQINDEWVFLSADKVIGAQGAVDNVSVQLEGKLANIRLPAPPTGDERVDAGRAYLSLMDVAPTPVMAALMGMQSRVILNEADRADFSLGIFGSTGNLKTSVVAAVQNCFGTTFTYNNLLGGWDSTDNALEKLLHDAKDILVPLDDLKPSGSQHGDDLLNRKVDRTLRSVANGGARERLRQDASSRPSYSPRSVPVVTGEDRFRGASLQARALIADIRPGDVNLERLTQVQKSGRLGLLAQDTTGFIQWLAPQMPRLKKDLREEVEALRDEVRATLSATSGFHNRTPEIVANLLIGWQYRLAYEVESGVISAADAEATMQQARMALLGLAREQFERQQSDDPVDAFVDILQAGLADGSFTFTNLDNRTSFGQGSIGVWENINQKTVKLGWVDERTDDLFVIPGAAYAAVQTYRRRGEGGLPIARETLGKRLNDRGLLKTTDDRQVAVRRRLEGAQRRVWHLRASQIVERAEQEAATPTQRPLRPE